MKTYIITKESKEAAKRVFNHSVNKCGHYPWSYRDAFNNALDALLVEQKPELPPACDRCGCDLPETKLVTDHGTFCDLICNQAWLTKEKSRMQDEETARKVNNLKLGDKVQIHGSCASSPIGTVIGIRNDLSAFQIKVEWPNPGIRYTSYENPNLLIKVEPKPFGPGTRLRAKNGDELRIINCNISSDSIGVINLTTNQIEQKENAFWTRDLKRLQDRLEWEGATII